MRKQVSRITAAALVAGLVVGIGGSPATATPGESLAVINVPNGCTGVGVVYDGTDILYTCFDGAVHKTDLAGNDNGQVTTVDAFGASVDVHAIAWDTTESRLWGGNLGGGQCHIWSIDLGTGLATLRFSFVDPHGGCDFSVYDGITVDTVTNTLYVSPDVHRFIHHFTKTGAPAANDNIPFQSMTAGECPWAQSFGEPGCLNSGLAIGIDGTLFAGTASDGKIFALDPNAPTVLGQFATVTGRDEDLECGPLFTKTDGSTVETILSRDFSDRIDVLEAPAGTCQSPTQPQTEIRLDPREDTNPAGTDHTVTATVTSGGNPVPGELVTFTVVLGPNAGETSGPGECSTDPNCVTDANGQTSWTYTSNGSPGTDVIEACVVEETGERRCARAEKTWTERVVTEGRMTGGGSVFTTAGDRVTHGFELHCDAAVSPNRLEVNWGKGNNFHLTVLTSARCTDDASIDEGQPVAGFDTYEGSGTGLCNGLPASARWRFTDAGEPGTSDEARIDIGGSCTLSVSGALSSGNHQAHPA